jgi:sulfur carrier protein
MLATVGRPDFISSPREPCALARRSRVGSRDFRGGAFAIPALSQRNARAAARRVSLTAPTPLNTVGFSLRRLDSPVRAANETPVEATPRSPQRAAAISVNGEPREIAPGETVQSLVAALGLTGRKIAIAVNRDVVPRAGYAARALHPGDRVEILEAVGGG